MDYSCLILVILFLRVNLQDVLSGLTDAWQRYTTVIPSLRVTWATVLLLLPHLKTGTVDVNLNF